MSSLKCYDQNLKAVESLLTQSISGVHILFDNKSILKAFEMPAPQSESLQNRQTELFLDFVKCTSLEEKFCFLKALNELEKSILIRSYFEILERSLKKAMTKYH